MNFISLLNSFSHINYQIIIKRAIRGRLRAVVSKEPLNIDQTRSGEQLGRDLEESIDPHLKHKFSQSEIDTSVQNAPSSTIPQTFKELQRQCYQTSSPFTRLPEPLEPNFVLEKRYRKERQDKLERKIQELEKKAKEKKKRIYVIGKRQENTAIAPTLSEDDQTLALATSSENKKFVYVDEENQHLRMGQLVAKLCKLPYDKQLKYKNQKNVKFLRYFSGFLSNLKVKWRPPHRNSLPCTLTQVRPSPVIDEYRNKDEFSIGSGIDGTSKKVGFFIGAYSEIKRPICVSPETLPTLKPVHKKAAKVFESYLQTSPLEVSHSFSEGGHWRNLVVRSNQQGDLMLIAILYAKDLSQDQLEAEKQRMRTFFSDGPGKSLPIKSLYVRTINHSNSSAEECPFDLVIGDPNLTETLGNFTFIVSPSTYLPINSAAALNFYDSFMELAQIAKGTTVIDLGCRSGILSLFLSKNAEKVIGIDDNKTLIEEAKANAALNGVTNVEFLSGPLTELLPYVLDDVFSDDIVVVTHATNAGLRKHILPFLRRKKDVSRVVYATSKPEAALQPNFKELCAPTFKHTLKGNPFLPTLAVQVDTLPHTYHCDLLLLFERTTHRVKNVHRPY